ncbi:hypothetical protein [Gryllotalpicola koreensis]|uniref:DUF4179 domain-containing protein n=1 Tax=Gryllotalpicola koreensis TaxID=993086 RepID=A0ABP7ZQB1_9MICO
MTELMDPVFAHGLRELLIRQVEAAPRRRRLARWRWGVGAVLAIGLLGGGTAIASQVFLQPGADAHANLAAPVSVTETGTATIQLGHRPKGASELYLELDPLDPGTYLLGRGGASVSADTSGNNATTYYVHLFELDLGGTSYTITTSTPTLRWTATLTWVSAHATAWGVNAAGQSYGVQNENGSPDLIAATATNGKDGYVLRTDLEDADGTTAMKSFHSPQDALDWQKAHEGKDVYIPVYRSDGKTRIGVFKVGP